MRLGAKFDEWRNLQKLIGTLDTRHRPPLVWVSVRSQIFDAPALHVMVAKRYIVCWLGVGWLWIRGATFPTPSFLTA
jgi:hypothetical protein